MTPITRLLRVPLAAAIVTGGLLWSPPAHAGAQPVYTADVTATNVTYGTITIDGLQIAYREAGDGKNPKLVLLHGWPSSSHQYRDLMVALAPRFHVIAPDYPGFGNSDRPDPATYHYSFEGISRTIEKFLAAKGFDHYGIFMQDYGGAGGFCIIGRKPPAPGWGVIQKTNTHEDG